MAQAEWLDGQEDGGRLGDVELVLQRADSPVVLQEETALHTAVVPLLERWMDHILRSPAPPNQIHINKYSK